MVKKLAHLPLCILMCLLFPVFVSSCGDDDKDEPTPPTPSSPIVGSWASINSTGEYFDNYYLVFSADNTGYIRNEYGSRGTSTEQMNFNWSLTLTSSGQYLLSVIYQSGDRDVDGPFSGGYAQYNRTVTIAGSTLSIMTGDNTVMLFNRQ